MTNEPHKQFGSIQIHTNEANPQKCDGCGSEFADCLELRFWEVDPRIVCKACARDLLGNLFHLHITGLL